MVSLQPVSYAHPLLPYQVVSICDLQRLALYWFHMPGLQLDNEVSQSTGQPHGTVCHQHYGHRICRRAPSFKRALKTHMFSTARRNWDTMILAPDINIQTYLLTYSHTWAENVTSQRVVPRLYPTLSLGQLYLSGLFKVNRLIDGYFLLV